MRACWWLGLAACGRLSFGGGSGSGSADGPVDVVAQDTIGDGLAMHLTFDDGPVTVDRTGRHDGMCGACPTIAAGRVGIASALFSGANCILVPDHADLRARDFTIALWMRRLAVTAQTVVGRAYMGASTNLDSWELHVTGMELYFHVSGTSVGGVALASPTWYHVAGVLAGGTMTLYVDGTARGTDTVTLSLDPAERVRVGCNQELAVETDYFDGYIDDVRFYTRELSPAEIAVLAAQ